MSVNYEEFDIDEYARQIQEDIKKPNIFVCGASQIGKSSLVNDILGLSVSKAETGDSGKSKTRGVHMYTSSDSNVNLYDSEGYEVGMDEQEHYWNDIIAAIDQQKKDYPDDVSKHIHEVWYCVSAANKRYYDLDRKLVNEIDQRQIPIAIIITKVDCIAEEELENLKKAIADGSPRVSIFTYSTEIDITKEVYSKYVQKEEIINWAVDHLQESFLQAGLLSTIRGGLKAKRNYVLKTVLPKYVSLAAGAVATTSVVSNLPFSDSVPLMALQVKMSMDIFKTYGMEHVEKKLVVPLLQTQVISYMGKTLASQLWGMIPFVGNFAKAAVNVSVAATITATIGAAITCITEKYLEECVNANGKENIPFMEYFTKDRMAQAIQWVKDNDNMGEDAAYSITGIVEDIVDKVKRR